VKTQEVEDNKGKNKWIRPQQCVLVVDDNEDTLILLRTILELNDYQVYLAQSGKKALQVLSEISPPDLILLDMQMDGMDGPDFLLVLEEKRPEIVRDVPIVFVTGMDGVPRGKAAGVIRKPIELDTFSKDIRRFVEPGSAHQQYEH
jgi:CheY-like chemotaxis protein